MYHIGTIGFTMKMTLPITDKLLAIHYTFKTYRSILQVEICYRVQSFSSFLLLQKVSVIKINKKEPQKFSDYFIVNYNYGCSQLLSSMQYFEEVISNIGLF